MLMLHIMKIRGGSPWRVFLKKKAIGASFLLCLSLLTAGAPALAAVGEVYSTETKGNQSMVDPQVTVLQMESGSILHVPTSWSSSNQEDHCQVVSPEKDLMLYFLEVPNSGNFQELVSNAWKTILPSFDLKPARELFPPAHSDWEKIYQVVYDVPSSESRLVIGSIGIFEGHAYIALLDSSLAGFGRRGAEMGSIFESWKPVGFEKAQVIHSQARAWTSSDIDSFEEFISTSMKKLKIPGAAISLVQKNGEVILRKGFGIKSLETAEAVAVDTPFLIGSTTKSLTTLMMARLIDQKKLSWETPITDLLPGFTVAGSEFTSKLSVRLSISASTGMPRRDLDFIFKHTGIKPEERLLEMKNMAPTTGFGETFQYSNYLFLAGGYAAARAYTQEGDLESAYSNAMQDLVFKPLRMKKTVLEAEEALKLGAASPHSIDFNGNLHSVPVHHENFAYSMAPVGAIWSTVEDLSHYLALEMNRGVLFDKGIVSEDTLLERRKPGIKIKETSSYGLGLIVDTVQGISIVHHGGATLGFNSDLFFLPESGIGMVVLTNVSSHYGQPFLSAVRQKFLELTFGVKERSMDIVDFAVTARAELTAKMLKDISIEPSQMTWVEPLQGSYSNPYLGDARLFKSETGNGYKMKFREWTSEIGVEVDSHGKRLLVLVGGPLPGSLKILVDEEKRALVLDGVQEKYVFTKSE